MTLVGYRAEMLVEVLRPERRQEARVTVNKVLSRPGSVTFQDAWFEGERFIKVNVISRILAEEKEGPRTSGRSP